MANEKKDVTLFDLLKAKRGKLKELQENAGRSKQYIKRQLLQVKYPLDGMQLMRLDQSLISEALKLVSVDDAIDIASENAEHLRKLGFITNETGSPEN